MFISRLCTTSVHLNLKSTFHTSAVAFARRWQDKTTPNYTKEFYNPVREVVGTEVPPVEKGHIYDNKPHRVTVNAGCSYTWCGCGLARTEQPYCDLTCQNLWLAKIMKGGPIRYIAPETKDLWLCNCKQTDHPPFCDGTHRSEEVQSSRFDGNKQLWEPRRKK